MFVDTIAAVSTPFGAGAIALLRVSGSEAREIVARIWRGQALSVPRHAYFGAIVDDAGRAIDQVLATWFQAPASYTGEDLVEIACHGGLLVTQRIAELLLGAGARPADPGEFTQRAFLNGKMDLTQAEAVMDLISAQSTLALRAANEQLQGRLGQKMRELREALLADLAHVEAWLDFPEEDIDPDSGRTLERRIVATHEKVDALLATADQGRVLRGGVRTVITGAPNVGKSSLLNLLLGFERAMVSDIAGTTRDTIEEVINLRGLPLRLVDTAGWRESSDALERESMVRTQRALDAADLVLELADASLAREMFASAEIGVRRLLVLNKIDLGEHPSWRGTEAVRLSCKEKTGVEALATSVFSAVATGEAPWGPDLVTINARHKNCLERARGYLVAALELVARGGPSEFVAEELRSALQAIGDVIGKVESEELLGVIFGRFCIGK
ncbi:MAG: tRNA uridine-5-carboxymethylaminomethyl(34) synthesis GTPase MnmE [Verrucomicrobiales bacterium]